VHPSTEQIAYVFTKESRRYFRLRRESRYSSLERDLKNQVFLYHQLLSHGKSREICNRVLKGSQAGHYLPPTSLFGSSLSKHQRGNGALDAEDSVVQKVRLVPKEPKMFAGKSPQSWVNKPKSAAGERLD